MPNIDIVREGNHYVAYVNGEFFCSADTHHEAVMELREEGIVE